MAKTVRNVMSSVSKDKQIAGMTMEEIRTEFMKAGYGVTKTNKRSLELLVSAQLQTNGALRNGRPVYYCIYWPFAYDVFPFDLDRVGTIEYVDPRHTILRRLDGRENAWLLE